MYKFFPSLTSVLFHVNNFNDNIDYDYAMTSGWYCDYYNTLNIYFFLSHHHRIHFFLDTQWKLFDDDKKNNFRHCFAIISTTTFFSLFFFLLTWWWGRHRCTLDWFNFKSIIDINHALTHIFGWTTTNNYLGCKYIYLSLNSNCFAFRKGVEIVFYFHTHLSFSLTYRLILEFHSCVRY